MVEKRLLAIEYMCTYCGRKETKQPSFGRPLPGVCPKRGKTSSGMTLPHRWIVNRRRVAN